MIEIKDEHKKFLKDLLNEFDKVKESSNSTETELKTTKVEVLKEMEDLSSKNSKDKLTEDIAIFKQLAYESNMDGYVELPSQEELNEIQELFNTNPLSKEELDEIQQLFDMSIVDDKVIKLLKFKTYYVKICAKYFNLRYQLKTFQSGNSNLLTESFFGKWFDTQVQYEIINKSFAKILEEFKNTDIDLKDMFSISEQFNRWQFNR